MRSSVCFSDKCGSQLSLHLSVSYSNIMLTEVTAENWKHGEIATTKCDGMVPSLWFALFGYVWVGTAPQFLPSPIQLNTFSSTLQATTGLSQD